MTKSGGGGGLTGGQSQGLAGNLMMMMFDFTFWADLLFAVGFGGDAPGWVNLVRNNTGV